ncbi:hypothetical protein DFQ30_009536 [Apophysomyces sp. BC1015]|nr:hypothetical protein DFQ30_009536 [Apophysomyces sp. BC1015]
MTVDNSPVGKDVIAHRGFSAEYPENTMISYKKAIEAGTTALEGDIRITKDGEVIMMHDLSLNRTTTGSGNVIDCNWYGDIENLTTKVGQEPIPRLVDVLDLLSSSQVVEKNMCMIIDIKFNNPLDILDAVHKLVRQYPSTLKKQLVIGIWNREFLAEAQRLFEGFQLCFIGLSLRSARAHFLHTTDAISVPFITLANDDGQAYIKEAHSLNKRVFSWTINDVGEMEKCTSWGIDGVVGDNTPLLLKHVHENIKHLSSEEFEAFVESQKYPLATSELIYNMLKTFVMDVISSIYIRA